jgi:hypothetical protein
MIKYPYYLKKEIIVKKLKRLKKLKKNNLGLVIVKLIKWIIKKSIKLKKIKFQKVKK